jgi:hypothetical protein
MAAHFNLALDRQVLSSSVDDSGAIRGDLTTSV